MQSNLQKIDCGVTTRVSPSRICIALAAAFWLVAAAFTFEIADAARPVHALRLRAYTTATWDGPVALEGLDATLSNELLGGRPFPSWSTYSIEWTGAVAVPEPGAYRFSLIADDRATLEVDGHTVVENVSADRNHVEFGTADLGPGLHDVRLRFAQNGGHYGLSLMWAHAGQPFQPVPAAQLFPERPSDIAYRLRHVTPVAAGAGALFLCAVVFAGLRSQLWRLAALLAGRRFDAAAAALARPLGAVTLVVVVGGVARLLVYLTTPAILWPDSHVFYVTTLSLLHGAWTSHDPYRTLIYPYFMAGFLKWSRDPAVGDLITVTQQELGLLSAALFYQVGRRAFTPLVALAGTLLFSVHALQLFYEVSVLTEALFTAVLGATLWLAARTFERPTLARAAMLGAAVAVLVLVRPVAQWFIVCVLAVGWFALPRGRRRLATAAVVLTCYAVPLVAWMAVNQRDYGFFGISLGRGMGLYTRVFDIDRLVPPAPSRYPAMRELWAFGVNQRWSANRVRDELNFVRGYTGARADDAMFAFTIETVAAQPLAYAIGTARQWLQQIADPQSGVRRCPSAAGEFLCSGRAEGESLPPFPNVPPPAPHRLRAAVNAYITAGAVRFEAVFALAVVGLLAWLRWPQRNAAGALLALAALYFTLIPALSQWDQDRFRLPVDAVFFMFAVWGARAIARRWSGPLGLGLAHDPVAAAS